jgi:putative tryptophan/tyrosine transport system substrate-binding protein
MPDKVGFLIAPKRGDWVRYIDWFSQELIRVRPTLRPTDIKFLPRGGAHGDPQDIATAAADLVNDPDVKVIVTAGTGAALACKAATRTKPFVFAAVGDPGLSGLVPPPQDNFTGGNNRQAVEWVVNKRVDYMLTNSIFQEPFAVVGNYNNQPVRTAMDYAYYRLRDHHRKQVAQLDTTTITPQDNIANFISGLRTQGIKSLYVCSDLYLTVNSEELNREAHKPPTATKLATMFEFEEHHRVHGADDYYGSDFQEMFTKAANYVNDILDGARPVDLPIYIASLSGRRPWPVIPTKRKKRSSRKKK